MFQLTQPKFTQYTTPNKPIKKIIQQNQIAAYKQTKHISLQDLFLAIQYYRPSIVRYILPHININGRNDNNDTIIHCIARYNTKPRILNMVLNTYTIPNKLNNQQETALDVAYNNQPNTKKKIIQQLKRQGFLANNHDVDGVFVGTDKGYMKTFLQTQTRLNNIIRQHYRLKNATSINITFVAACKYGTNDDVYLIIQSGILKHINFNEYFTDLTPCIALTQAKRYTCLKHIIDIYNADPSVVNTYNKNALHYIQQDTTLASILLDKMDIRDKNKLSHDFYTPLDILYESMVDYNIDYSDIESLMVSKDCLAYRFEDGGVETAVGFGTYNQYLIECCRNDTDNVITLLQQSNKYTKGVALNAAAEYKQYKLVHDILQLHPKKDVPNNQGMVYTHHMASWVPPSSTDINNKYIQTIIDDTPAYLWNIKDNIGKNAIDYIILQNNWDIQYMIPKKIQKKKTTQQLHTCKKKTSSIRSIHPPTNILQQNKIYSWKTSTHELQVRVSQTNSGNWYSTLDRFIFYHDNQHSFYHLKDTQCNTEQKIQCSFDNKQTISIDLVYLGACPTRQQYDTCDCIKGMCTMLVGHTMYALLHYIQHNLQQQPTHGSVYIESKFPCNAFNCYNRAFEANHFYLTDKHEFNDFLDDLKTWDTTHDFQFTFESYQRNI